MKNIHIYLLSILLAALFTACTNKSPEDALPNILLITADDMNWNSVGVYMSTVSETTPNIDQLACSTDIYISWPNGCRLPIILLWS